MALSGLDIFKKLPKTNCKECGFPTCLAFAMKLAAGQIEIEACPYVSEEAKTDLLEAAAPPIRKVTIGKDENALVIGEELVLFRHEKTFVHPPGFGILVKDDLSDSEIEDKVKKINEVSYERVGQVLKANIIAVESTKDAARFTEVVKKIKNLTTIPLVLMSKDPSVIKSALDLTSEGKPLIYGANKDNYEQMAGLAKEYNCPLTVISDNGLASLAETTEKIANLGLKEIVLDPTSVSLDVALKDLVFIRRAALQKKFRPLGYPVITFPYRQAEDDYTEALVAAVYLLKYAGIIVFNSLEPWKALPLMVLRQNIFTDPQRPLTVDEGVYEIGKPDENSPVLVTTNFSLTYFIVSTEVETSRVPSWLCIMDAEGLSVLTAWAAGKFTPERIAPFIKRSGINDKISHNKLIIPGYLAQISGELEDELSDSWKVVIGPREAGDLPAFLKSWSP